MSPDSNDPEASSLSLYPTISPAHHPPFVLDWKISLVAHFLSETGRHDDALTQWQRALSLSPSDFDVVFNVASTLRQLKRTEQAEEFYKKAADLSPQVKEWPQASKNIVIYELTANVCHVNLQDIITCN